MMKLSRRRIAQYVALRLVSDDGTTVMKQLAAYLIDRRAVAQAGLYISDIERELAASGFVAASVTTTRPLGDELRVQLRDLIAARNGGAVVQLREIIEPKVLGGVLVQTPTETLDATVRASLRSLRSVAR